MIEVGLSGLPLRNVLWNCAAVPEGLQCGFAVGCEDSEDTGFCPLRIMWCALEQILITIGTRKFKPFV